VKERMKLSITLRITLVCSTSFEEYYSVGRFFTFMKEPLILVLQNLCSCSSFVPHINGTGNLVASLVLQRYKFQFQKSDLVSVQSSLTGTDGSNTKCIITAQH
jgi:hypothetical protein